MWKEVVDSSSTKEECTLHLLFPSTLMHITLHIGHAVVLDLLLVAFESEFMRKNEKTKLKKQFTVSVLCEADQVV